MIAKEFGSEGIRNATRVDRGGVGYVGTEAPTVSLRVDKGALSVEQLNEVLCRSEMPRKAHACGHDAHVSMSLGAATILAREDMLGEASLL